MFNLLLYQDRDVSFRGLPCLANELKEECQVRLPLPGSAESAFASFSAWTIPKRIRSVGRWFYSKPQRSSLRSSSLFLRLTLPAVSASTFQAPLPKRTDRSVPNLPGEQLNRILWQLTSISPSRSFFPQTNVPGCICIEHAEPAFGGRYAGDIPPPVADLDTVSLSAAVRITSLAADERAVVVGTSGQRRGVGHCLELILVGRGGRAMLGLRVVSERRDGKDVPPQVRMWLLI